MPVQVKICGINSAAAADAVLRAGADFGGLVFFAKSPRHLGLDEGARLAERMRGRLKLAALVVDESDDRLAAIASASEAGLLPAAWQARRRRAWPRYPQRVSAFPSLRPCRWPSPAILPARPTMTMWPRCFCSMPRPPPMPRGPAAMAPRSIGGCWQGGNFRRPWFLAGGLTPDNVARAIAVSGAQMVDVSSGVESAPGVKSESLYRRFCRGGQSRG